MPGLKKRLRLFQQRFHYFFADINIIFLDNQLPSLCPGQIQVILSEGTNGGFTNVDSIAFQNVPEPSAAALLGLGGLALLRRRRK